MTDTNAGASPLHGRTALITGSSSGIGAGVAVAFARAGAAHVIVNYPSSEQAAAAEAAAHAVAERMLRERGVVRPDGAVAVPGNGAWLLTARRPPA